MSEYRCECGETKEESTGVTIKVIDGEVRPDVRCQCGKYMTLAAPKEGMPSFSSNRWGQVR